MELILKAIKAFFRIIEKSFVDLEQKVKTAQNTADTALATNGPLVIPIYVQNNGYLGYDFNLLPDIEKAITENKMVMVSYRDKLYYYQGEGTFSFFESGLLFANIEKSTFEAINYILLFRSEGINKNWAAIKSQDILPAYFTVTYNLTNAQTGGVAYGAYPLGSDMYATIKCDSGYVFSSVTATMGTYDITVEKVSDTEYKIRTTSVQANIVITAVAEPET